MKFTCNKETLMKEIIAAQKIISQKNQITIISNVLLECENDHLIIRATDAKLRFESKIPVITHQNGKIAIFCDRFTQILKALPNGDLNFETNEEIVNISIEKYPKIHYQLRYQSAENFPWAQDPQQDEFFTLNKKELLNMINTTIFAVSTDEMRLFLNGVFMEKQDNKLIMIATDGKRLSYIEQELETEINSFEGIIIPPKFLQLIRDLSINQEGQIALAIKDNHVYSEFDGIKISSSLIDGQFPAYRRAIPEHQEYSLVVSRVQLQEAINRMKIMADAKAKRIYLTVEESGEVSFHVEESKMGKASDAISCEYEGPQMPFAFNFDHFLEPLKAMDSEEVRIEFTHTDKAITLASEPKAEFFHVIMSMQLDNVPV